MIFGIGAKKKSEYVAPAELVFNVPFEAAWKRVDRVFAESRTQFGDRWKLVTRDVEECRMFAELQMTTDGKLGGPNKEAYHEIFKRLEAQADLKTPLLMTIALTLLFAKQDGGSTKLSFNWKYTYKGLVEEKLPQRLYLEVQQNFYELLSDALK